MIYENVEFINEICNEFKIEDVEFCVFDLPIDGELLIKNKFITPNQCFLIEDSYFQGKEYLKYNDALLLYCIKSCRDLKTLKNPSNLLSFLYAKNIDSLWRFNYEINKI